MTVTNAGPAPDASAPWTWARLRETLSIEHRLVGASLLRIAAGAIMLFYLVGHWPQRQFLWGPEGVYPAWLIQRELPVTRAPTFLGVDSALAFDLLYLTAIGIAALYTIGWHTRLVGIWFYVAVWSVLKRNPLILTGGDTLFLVELPFLLLMNTSAYLSADSGWRRPGEHQDFTPRPFRALLHNAGLLGALMQLSIMYWFSGFYKLTGETWQHGTAIYYALRAAEFNAPGLSALIYMNPILVGFITYSTLLFELGFPFLVWGRATRWIVASGAVLFHSGIGLVMGLGLFAAQVLIFQLIVIDDRSYLAGVRRLGALKKRLTTAVSH